MLKEKKSIKRVFFGIPVSFEQIEKFKQHVISQHPEISNYYHWTKSENCHITVFFIGDIEEYKIPELISQVEQALSQQPAFSAAVEKIALFPPGRDRIIAVHISLVEPMQDLFKSVVNALSTLSLYPDKQEFLPHITLSRNRSHKRFNFAPMQLQSEILRVNELILYESELKEGGSHYTVLHRFKFV